MAKKFLDSSGLTYLVSKLDDYPTNDILAAVIDGIDEVKQDTIPLLNNDNLTITTDSTKGTSPYNTGYGYTNLTADTSKVSIDGSNLTNGTIIGIMLSSAVNSSYRNVRIRFGSDGDWIPLYVTTGIMAGSSYLGASSYRQFVYSTAVNSSGAFHMINDSNSTYSPAQVGSGYGTCATAAATTAKVVTLSSYSLQTGGIVTVKFTYDVPANATMNINSKGAKAIYYQGSAIEDNVIKAGAIATFVYDGSHYDLLSTDNLELNPTYQQIIDALGFTPYSDENPEGYIDTISSGDVTTALGYTPLNSSLKGSNNGLAELDANGKVLSSQLPSYVDDVLEYSSKSGFPTTGESGKIYISQDDNKTYRWSGSAYTEISPSLALGETAATAYRGDRGKVAYDHSQTTSGNPHNVTKSDLSLGNVENKSSATIRGELTSSNVTTALGFTPYNATNPNGYINSITGSDVTTALGYTPYDSTNPNNYIDATTTSLNNYYKKTEVDGMVANRFQAVIVSALPISGISTSTIYMVLQTGQTDIYDEWMYISNTWTKIGTTSIDMSDYAKKAELHNVATTGAYSSLVGKPTIPTDTSDLTNSAGYITKTVNNLDNYTPTSNLADVAISGSYTDLVNKPTIPSAVSALTNDEGYIKQSDLASINISSFNNDVPYATLDQIERLQNIDVDEIQRAIAATQNIGTVTQVTAGTGLTGGGTTSVTLNHSNSVTEKTSYPSGTTLTNGGSFVIRDVKYDAQGHITGTQDRTIQMSEIPAYNDTVVRGLIQDNADDIDALSDRIDYHDDMFRDTFTSFVFCIFGIEPYIDPSTMAIVPNRYYQRSDVDTGIFMDNKKVDIHLKTWLKYHYGIESLDKLKNVTCYVYAMGDHDQYVNHMVTFWSQMTNPDITSYPDLQQVGSFIDDGYGSVHRFTTNQVGAILSCEDDGYVAADPLGTGKGYVSGWNTLKGQVSDIEDEIGDIASILDSINGEVI